jgi:hypothetical protein
MRSLKKGIGLPYKKRRVRTFNPDTIPPDDADYPLGPYQMTHPLNAQELFIEEARWNGQWHRGGSVPAVRLGGISCRIAEADGDVFIGHEGISPLWSTCGFHTDNQGTREKSLSLDAMCEIL